MAQDRRRNMEFEYQQAHELFRHYDASTWLIGSIMLPVAFGLLGISFTTAISINILGKIFLAISSLALYLIWYLLDDRLNFYLHIILKTLWRLEGETREGEPVEPNLGFLLHREIRRRDRTRPLGYPLRMRTVRNYGFIALFVLWILRISLAA